MIKRINLELSLINSAKLLLKYFVVDDKVVLIVVFGKYLKHVFLFKAQGLREIITSCRKLSVNENHRIYVMKSPNINKQVILYPLTSNAQKIVSYKLFKFFRGKGCVVGHLKVGEKHLFVYDAQGRNHEINALCVLDFYVHESQQRKGFGKNLFDMMLTMENVLPEHIAIDKPSDKSIRFLKKHYNLKNSLPQVNNFVVFQGFFDNRSPVEFGKRSGKIERVYSRERELTIKNIDVRTCVILNKNYFQTDC